MAIAKEEKPKLRPIIVNDEIDLIAVWERIRTRWIMIFLFILIGAVSGMLIGRILPEKYDANAVLMFPSVWEISPDVSLRIVENYVEKMEYDGVAISVKFYGENKFIEIDGTGSSVGEVKRVLYDVKEAIATDKDIAAYRDKSLKIIYENKLNLENQLEDAYAKKDMYDMLVESGQSDVILGSNPIEINETIVNLEEKRSKINADIDKSDSVQWSVSPSSSEKNVQISWKVVTVIGLFMGGTLGVFVAILKRS
ncbi:MAG TPA: Wzz/FepE/Etk N-terminal domain-containing protein [Candidatus Dojkabacteria bacterium]|nr:Wzz/FepE/Etk N-terminal domain-containing protein [Candidatus Dojkabacteria bacterium]